MLDKTEIHEFVLRKRKEGGKEGRKEQREGRKGERKKKRKGKEERKERKKETKVFLYCRRQNTVSTRNDIFQKPRAQTVRRNLNEEWLFT